MSAQTAIHDGVPKLMLGLCAAALLARWNTGAQEQKFHLC